MRKASMYTSILLMIASFLFSFAGSCPNTDGLPPYYIKFDVNGDEVVFDLGLTDIEKNAFASAYAIGDNIFYTLFFATPDAVDSFTIPDKYILIRILSDTPGTYTYGTGGENLLEIQYRDIGSGYMYKLVEASVTVTSFGNVGEAIIGTFSATFGKIEPLGKGYALLFQISNGEFKVKRAVDGIPDPFIN